MRIISWNYGLDIPYEGVSLVLESRLDDDEWEKRREKNPDDPVLEYVDIFACGASVPNGKIKIGAYSDYECAEEVLCMIVSAFTNGKSVMEMPSLMSMDKKMKDKS